MHQHCRPAQRSLVSAALREVFNTDTPEQARERVSELIERLAPVVPKVCSLLEEAEEDLLAFYRFPPAHWSKLRSTTRSSGSTARSAAAPTSSASSPTTPP